MTTQEECKRLVKGERERKKIIVNLGSGEVLGSKNVCMKYSINELTLGIKKRNK